MKFKVGQRVVITKTSYATPEAGQVGDMGTVIARSPHPQNGVYEVEIDDKPRTDNIFKGWVYYGDELAHTNPTRRVEATDEAVNHPAHYGGENNPYEAIKVIEAWELDFCLGNAVKYISRAGKKTPNAEQDLEKAVWYLQRRLKQIRDEQSPPKHLK